MTKILKPIILIFFGVLIGTFGYSLFVDSDPNHVPVADTVFVKPVLANETGNISSTRRNALTMAVKKISPAVVSINVTKIDKYVQRSPYRVDPWFREFFPEMFNDRIIQRPVNSIGSGFLISADGYIVTNEHVVGNAKEIIVAMPDGTEYDGKLVGNDHVTDISLIKIDVENLAYATFGDSDDILIGEWAIALGNPFGLFTRNKATVTVGVVSAIDRDFSPLDGRVYEDMIQTDASINNGNSGGPLCNADGKVIGMNTFIFTGDQREKGSVGVGFAIPSNRIKRLVEEIKKRPPEADSNIWIGMYVGNLSRYLARQLNYPSLNGVFVKRIDRNSPASKADVQLGDIITEINGRTIRGFRDAEDIIISADLRVGDKLTVKIWRQGNILDKTLTLEKYPR